MRALFRSQVQGSGGARAAHDPGRARQAFTLIELLTVISIIAVLVGLLVPLAGVASRKMRESTARADLKKLETAIESYKAAVGYYPPDNVVQRTPTVIVDPNVNQLYYELVGCASRQQGAEYRTTDKEETIAAQTLRQFFHTGGIVNSKPEGERVKSFLIGLTAKQKGEISANPDVDVLTVQVDWPLGRRLFRQGVEVGPPLKPLANERALRLNPWRYVSTNPTNNPTTFDLWAEVPIGKEVKIIGNW